MVWTLFTGSGASGQLKVGPLPAGGGAFVGIAQLVLSCFALSGLDSSAKWLLESGAFLLLVVWFRYVVHLVLGLVIVVPAKGKQVLRSVHPRYQILRGGFMLSATLAGFTTLSYLPQAQTTAIGFLAPLLVLAVAPWILKEPPKVSRWVAAITGFVGVLIVVRPGSGLSPIGTFFGLLTALLMAGQYTVNRLVYKDNAFTTLIWSGLVGSVTVSIILIPFLPSVPGLVSDLSVGQWLVLFSTGVWGALGHLLQIQAYRNASASLLLPFFYSEILSATLLGWMIWDDMPDLTSWVGILIIVGSGLAITLVEWQRGHVARHRRARA
ncbi:Drug/metabolite transporter (DMT)-like permease OS=Castellaniella defragrans OX=75697 GN=HNR28_001098 PE=4 SV=1 [Castellaniella defragrans]